MLKSTIILLTIFLIWFFPSLWFANGQTKAIPFIFGSFFFIIFITCNIYRLIQSGRITNDYLFANFNTYLFYQSFTFFFFIFKNMLIALILILITLLFSLLIYKESRKVDKITAYLVLPYLFWIAYLFFFISINWL